MLITFEVLENNDIYNKVINVTGKNANDIKKYFNYKNIKIYQNTNIIDDTFNKWSNDNQYFIYIENDIYISFQLNNNSTPYLNYNMTIKEIKNILSIKDEIFFNNVKLNDNYTLKYYNINNYCKLYTQPDSVVSCVV